MEVYSRFKSERDIFTSQIVYYREDTLMGLVTYKDTQRCYEKEYQSLERIKHIREVQTG
jgi:hypothetical protein